MSELLLLPIGAAIGVLLGSVGGGGSLIAVPALVYIGDQSVRGAQAGSLIVIVVASAIGLAAYLRRDEVRWRAGTAFGLAAGVSSFACSLLSRQLNPDVLLLAFSPVMVLGAVAMVSERAAAESSFQPWRVEIRFDSVRKVTALGFAVGCLTGLFGVGGGFVIVPVLVVGLGFAFTEAVGTSLLVIIISSAVALAERLQSGAVDWAVIGPFAAAAVAGVLVGTWLGGRLPRRVLTRWFAVVVVATAVYTATQALAALL
ncbi:MAG: sulfite exporter TauE/SafE family protein [Actinobacteria bacterium]|nr:sulfite exporter TauE/SafE family protein [Actinomycetota bacterium]